MKKLWIELFSWFVKITAWPVQYLCFRTRIFRESPAQGRRISGPAIVISNHTSVYDFAVYLFVFPLRTVHYLMGEALFIKKGLGCFLKSLGGIPTDRRTHTTDGIEKCRAVVERGGIAGIFPEGRVPKPGESHPLPFRNGAAVLALSTGAKVIPVVSDGRYFQKKRAHVLIGTPIYAADYVREDMTEREAESAVTAAMREEIIRLEKLLDEKKQNKA